jgi:hypothetical protein
VPLSCAASQHSPVVRGAGVLRDASSPGRIPLLLLTDENAHIALLWYIPRVRVFDKATVGCVTRLTLKGVLSITVEFERSLLTANQLRNHILHIFMCGRKLCLSGGIS